jgi:SAM-dependent methyltransferase
MAIPAPASTHGAASAMTDEPRLSSAVGERLRCPACGARVEMRRDEVACAGAGCGARFPVVRGVPVLIDESTSLFSLDDYRSRTGPPPPPAVQSRIRRAMPEISLNVNGPRNLARFAGLLLERSAAPRVLVVGGRITGCGMEALLEHPDIEMVETDVSFGPRTALVCDAHRLPFADGSFDGVVAQAVLEHVLDPHRCVAEIHRVLAPGGLVYAETPFMQQVHAGRYDFTRFTHLGHRRLFRHFAEIDSGAVCGPGMALAWSYTYFLASFSRGPATRLALRGVAHLTSFFLKYLDGFLVDRPMALDAASACYFMGSRAEHPLPDRELIALYRGGFGATTALRG